MATIIDLGTINEKEVEATISVKTSRERNYKVNPDYHDIFFTELGVKGRKFRIEPLESRIM